MSKQHRSFLLVSLVTAFLLASIFAVVQAQEGKSPAVKQARWSDAATWPDRRVPRAGDKVTIAAGKDIVLDVSPPALGGLTIDGKLSFANNKDLELTTEWVMLHGELEIGTEAKPHTRKATITFTDNVKGEDFGGMGGNDRSAYDDLGQAIDQSHPNVRPSERPERVTAMLTMNHLRPSIDP